MSRTFRAITVAVSVFMLGAICAAVSLRASQGAGTPPQSRQPAGSGPTWTAGSRYQVNFKEPMIWPGTDALNRYVICTAGQIKGNWIECVIPGAPAVGTTPATQPKTLDLNLDNVTLITASTR